MPTPYISRITTSASPPSRRSLRSLLQDPSLAPCVASLSPRAGPHSFLAICTDCMAGIPSARLLVDQIGRILKSLLRRASNPPPSNPASQHRTRSVSSSLGQGSKVERISSSLALCHTFDLASAQSQALSSDRAFFSSWPKLVPFALTDCRCARCMAGMLTYLLLTKRSKSIRVMSLVKPLRILLPRTRFLRHRT